MYCPKDVLSMMVNTYYIAPSKSLTAIKLAITDKFMSQAKQAHTLVRTHLDTLDWRLHKNGYRLAYEHPREEPPLQLRKLSNDEIVSQADCTTLPSTPRQIGAGKLRTLITPILQERALAFQIQQKVTQHTINIHNKSGKTIAVIQLETIRHLAPMAQRSLIKCLHYNAIKGYEKENQGIKKFLDKHPALSIADTSELTNLIEHFNIDTNAFNGKPRFTLAPDARTDGSAKNILSSFAQNMELNTPGVIEDIDPECVHDFRIAVRRTRTLLGQVTNIFPAKRLQSAKTYFARLGAITTPLRDLDVMLMNFDDYRSLLPINMQQDLDSAYQYMDQQRAVAYKAVKQHLQSKRHQNYMDSWKVFLESDVPENTTLNNAKRPAKEIADRRIWKAYTKLIKQGSAINDDSPPDDLHTLRKSSKKLRYLLEFFQSLYPKKKIKATIRTLKTLQDLLGEYQDLHVHIDFFDDLYNAMQRDQLLGAKTAAALIQVNKALDVEQLECRKQFEARFKQFNSKSHNKEFKGLFLS